MVRQSLVVLLVLALSALLRTSYASEAPPVLSELSADFERYSGAKLVFNVDALPPGNYHDAMPELDAERQVAAARIACREVRKLPPGYLGAVGMKAVGIFARCVSRKGDGFRPYDKELHGYRYFGIYNGADAVAAAYYSDEQLPLTFHHEIFHHLDRVSHRSEPARADDTRLEKALAGKEPYPPPAISGVDLASLRRRCDGETLETTVSEYASKNPAEDKAETARHLMSTLVDSLVQVTGRPELPGSQRLLHVLNVYDTALADDGPAVDWFVDVALGRSELHPLALKNADLTITQIIESLEAFVDRRADAEALPTETVRRLLVQAAKQSGQEMGDERAVTLANAAAAATRRLLTDRICPRGDERSFVVMGHEDADGVNWTLRHDIEEFGHDARRLKRIVTGQPELLSRTQLKNLRLIAGWYVYIASRWQVTGGTLQLFERARATFAASLADDDAEIAKALLLTDLKDLGGAISTDGTWTPRSSANPYLKNVDEEISAAAVRMAIRRVQPACVRLAGGSGVNLAANGRVLTAAHVAGHVGARLTAQFPDGRRFTAECVAHDPQLDLSLCRLIDARDLPFAQLAGAPPKTGTPVVCIGQPGSRTPSGEATDYQPFHVSTGTIRGFLDDRLGDQRLGGCKHDAWTYWGHSGSPLFNERGEIIAMHNSWDSNTAMRHAVTFEAIEKFLEEHHDDVGVD
ncbi:MAG TPA: serine protease [Pirellulales bacterium]|nr:serine protease [Pirellulales bacterium]